MRDMELRLFLATTSMDWIRENWALDPDIRSIWKIIRHQIYKFPSLKFWHFYIEPKPGLVYELQDSCGKEKFEGLLDFYWAITLRQNYAGCFPV